MCGAPSCGIVWIVDRRTWAQRRDAQESAIGQSERSRG